MVAVMVALTLVALIGGLVEVVSIAYRCSSSDVLDEPDPDPVRADLLGPGRNHAHRPLPAPRPRGTVAIGGGMGLEGRNWRPLLIGTAVGAFILAVGLVILSLPRT